MVGTTDTVYTGFGFEGMDAVARPEFMKRTLDYLGVATGSPGQAREAQAEARVREDQVRQALAGWASKGRVRVRINCTGDTGARCKGKVRLKRRGEAASGAKKYDIAAGKTKTVVVKLKQASFKKLKRHKRSLKVRKR